MREMRREEIDTAPFMLQPFHAQTLSFRAVVPPCMIGTSTAKDLPFVGTTSAYGQDAIRSAYNTVEDVTSSRKNIHTLVLLFICILPLALSQRPPPSCQSSSK